MGRMLRIFVYEHITALGLGREAGSPGHSLFVEGRAMLDAICDDLQAIPGVEVFVGGPDDFSNLAAEADWSFVIAPETDGVLLKLAEEVVRVGGRLLGPSPAAIALTSDKYALFQHWKQSGVRTPETVLVPEPPPSWPCVVKLRDGAGSEGMRLVRTEEEYRSYVSTSFQLVDKNNPSFPPDDVTPAKICRQVGNLSPRIAQPHCPGTPASIAFLIGPQGTIALPATFQLISTDGQFCYGGGLVPIAPELAARAEALGRSALAGLPGLLGYVGVDLILEEAEDVAVEINPRLTTSYVGLRQHLDGNLAQLILDIASGAPGTVHLTPRGRVAFWPDGRTRIDPAHDFWNDPSEFSENCPG